MFPLLEPHWRLSGSTEADRSPCDTFLWVTYSTSFRHVLHVDRIIGLLVCFDALCSQTLDYFVGSFFFHPSSPLFFHFYNPLTRPAVGSSSLGCGYNVQAYVRTVA